MYTIKRNDIWIIRRLRAATLVKTQAALPIFQTRTSYLMGTLVRFYINYHGHPCISISPHLWLPRCSSGPATRTGRTLSSVLRWVGLLCGCRVKMDYCCIIMHSELTPQDSSEGNPFIGAPVEEFSIILVSKKCIT